MAERKRPKRTRTAPLTLETLEEVLEDAFGEELRRMNAELDRSIERMRKDREEIDRLKEETRAAISRWKAA
ncbi:MAG TPA: hypothetical protein VN282_09525 [Pyrinomonadaceae bacterium]|nr:hypothetical protein [Pyrinomonadaceae bacterium]